MNLTIDLTEEKNKELLELVIENIMKNSDTSYYDYEVELEADPDIIQKSIIRIAVDDAVKKISTDIMNLIKNQTDKGDFIPALAKERIEKKIIPTVDKTIENFMNRAIIDVEDGNSWNRKTITYSVDEYIENLVEKRINSVDKLHEVIDKKVNAYNERRFKEITDELLKAQDEKLAAIAKRLIIEEKEKDMYSEEKVATLVKKVMSNIHTMD